MPTEVGPEIEQLFLALDAVTDDALIIVDRRCNVLCANQLAFDEFGGRIRSYPLNNFIRHPDFFRSIQQALEDGRTGELIYTRADHVQRSFRIRCAPLFFEYVLITFVDLTKAQSLEKIQTDFVANVSHELRSPLTVIRGFLETLQDGALHDGEAADRFLTIMNDEAGRMDRLISDLLSLSHIEAEEHLPPRDIVLLKPCLSNVVDALSLRARERGMAIVVSQDLPDGLIEPEIYGNSDAVEQVLHNLIENAVKYGRENSAIGVTLSLSDVFYGAPQERYVRVQVENSGDGIPAQHIPRLTERFYRIDKSRSRQLGGTGLGLAIVKHIVNWHQGRLAIESEMGGQTRFTVSFPCLNASAVS